VKEALSKTKRRHFADRCNATFTKLAGARLEIANGDRFNRFSRRNWQSAGAAGRGLKIFIGYRASFSPHFVDQGSSSMKTLFSRFGSDESGATAIEYGMIAALIAVAIIGSLKLVGSGLTSKFSAISANLN
jgi:pilus assembly protein Flp/PilA